MKIRLLKKKDVRAATEIITKNYSKEYGRRSLFELKEMFGRGPIKPVYFAAEENKKIVGFAGFMQSWVDYNIYLIFWVNVLPKKQNQGIGKKLISRVLSEIKKKKNADLILLTADATKNLPNYYRKNFKFKFLESFNNKGYCLMSLSLEKK